MTGSRRPGRRRASRRRAARCNAGSSPPRRGRTAPGPPGCPSRRSRPSFRIGAAACARSGAGRAPRTAARRPAWGRGARRGGRGRPSRRSLGRSASIPARSSDSGTSRSLPPLPWTTTDQPSRSWNISVRWRRAISHARIRAKAPHMIISRSRSPARSSAVCTTCSGAGRGRTALAREAGSSTAGLVVQRPVATAQLQKDLNAERWTHCVSESQSCSAIHRMSVSLSRSQGVRSWKWHPSRRVCEPLSFTVDSARRATLIRSFQSLIGPFQSGVMCVMLRLKPAGAMGVTTGSRKSREETMADYPQVRPLQRRVGGRGERPNL